MATLTQGQIATSIRNKLNNLNTNRFSNSMVYGWINEGVSQVARIAESHRASSTVSTVADTQEYDAPDDAVRIHMVQWDRGDGQVYDLEYVDQKNASSVAWTGIAQDVGTPAIFWLWGYPPNLKINLYPIPGESGTLTVHYYKIPADLATDGSDVASTIDVPQGWETCVVDYAVYQALLSDADDRWIAYKQLYDTNLKALSEAATRYIDQSGMFYNGRQMVPQWLYDMD